MQFKTSMGTVTNDFLNLRRGPSLSFQPVKDGFQLKRGDSVLVLQGADVIADSHLWAAVVNGDNLVGYAAVQNLKSSSLYITLDTPSPIPPAPPPPPTTATYSKVGLHFTDGPTPPGLWDMISQAAAANRPVPGITVVDNHGYVSEIKRRSPHTKVAIRQWPDGSPDVNNPETVFSQQWAAMSALKGVADYFTLTNEWGNNLGGDVLARFWNVMMDKANSVGIKITILDWAYGWGEADQISALMPTLQRAAREGHPLNYHCYADRKNIYHPMSNWQWYAGRALDWLKQVPGLLLWGGEAGIPDEKDQDGVQAHFRGSSDMLNVMTELDAVAMQAGSEVTSRIISLNYWATTTDERWRSFEIAPGYADYLAYLKK